MRSSTPSYRPQINTTRSSVALSRATACVNGRPCADSRITRARLFFKVESAGAKESEEESSPVSGHDFSRAVKTAGSTRASAPGGHEVKEPTSASSCCVPGTIFKLAKKLKPEGGGGFNPRL